MRRELEQADDVFLHRQLLAPLTSANGQGTFGGTWENWMFHKTLEPVDTADVLRGTSAVRVGLSVGLSFNTAMICSGKSCVEEEVESPAPTPLESEDFAELMWAYLDCFSGVSGNMFLGALLDAGVPAEVFEDAIASMGLENVEVKSSVVRKHGIAGQYVEVVYPKQRVRRHLQEITDIIQGAGLDQAVSSKAVKVFRRLAEAEAKAHGTAMDKIHFHEWEQLIL